MARQLKHERERDEKAARREAAELDNETLATRLLMAAEAPRRFGKPMTKALQYEAAIRLRKYQEQAS